MNRQSDDYGRMMSLVQRTRSCRRFDTERRLERRDLEALVDLGRMTACGSNCQALRYRLVWERGECAQVFPHTNWAGRLGGWRPDATEQPAAYILVMAVPKAGPTIPTDAGIAMQTMLLAATAAGLSGCILGAVDRPKLTAALKLPDGLDLLYVVAMGVAAESWQLEEAKGGEIAYYRDAAGVHHVPKRPLSDVLLN